MCVIQRSYGGVSAVSRRRAPWQLYAGERFRQQVDCLRIRVKSLLRNPRAGSLRAGVGPPQAGTRQESVLIRVPSVRDIPPIRGSPFQRFGSAASRRQLRRIIRVHSRSFVVNLRIRAHLRHPWFPSPMVIWIRRLTAAATFRTGGLGRPPPRPNVVLCGQNLNPRRPLLHPTQSPRRRPGALGSGVRPEPETGAGTSAERRRVSVQRSRKKESAFSALPAAFAGLPRLLELRTAGAAFAGAIAFTAWVLGSVAVPVFERCSA